ncbi:transcription factor CRZ1, partial [Tremellales sp. Uapishka_1]
MSIPSPSSIEGPSFDSIFNHQVQRPSSSHSRSHSHNTSRSNSGPFAFAAAQGHFRPIGNLTDEPQSLHQVGNGPGARSRAGSSASTRESPRDFRFGDLVKGVQEPDRQDSFPFDPTSSSTLIATDPKAHPPPNQIVPSPYQTPQSNEYAFNTLQNGYHPDPYHHHQPHQQQPPLQSRQENWNTGEEEAYVQYATVSYPNQHHSPLATPSSAGFMGTPGLSATPGSAFVSDTDHYRSTPYASPHPTPGGWGTEFLGSADPTMDGDASEYGSRRGSWIGHQEDTGMDDLLSNLGEPEMHEIHRIISNASSHGSRENLTYTNDAVDPASPHPNINLSPKNGFVHQRHDSHSSSRSTSPFAQPMQNIISPPPTASGSFHRAGSSSYASSPHNKPQSPPALIIPGISPPPPLPPIVTTTAETNPSNAQPYQGQPMNFGDSNGSLFPPANPLLEHMTGMAGISPIGPNTDGPMIYIQPSTPISALNGGHGVWDAALKRAHGSRPHDLHNNVPPPRPSPEIRSSSRPSDHNLQQENSLQGASDRLEWAHNHSNGGGRQSQHRPRAKSDSYTADEGFDKHAFMQFVAAQHQQQQQQLQQQQNQVGEEWQTSVDAWRSSMNDGNQISQLTLDPRQLPGNNSNENLLQQSPNTRAALSLDTRRPGSDVLKYEPGEFSPTSLQFYASLGVNPANVSQQGVPSSAPSYQTTFQHLYPAQQPQTAGPAAQNFLQPSPENVRRRSFGETHPAAGAGTPGYGVEFTSPTGNALQGRVRGLSPGKGHRRFVRSEDLGRGTGWGVGSGGSTTEFLHSITNPHDGTLGPPSFNGHSRHSSVSSQRSASPALSISSQGSSYSPGRMEMPDGVQIPQLYNEVLQPIQTGRMPRVPKPKVTSVATEQAIPGCGSTFTRHFNLKGHLRSHNDEKPFKCIYEGCPKATVGFARQHDCKRHMLLHEGLRPFECDGCGKKFARLDALTRHHKSEQGQECAISHPLPTNPDGSYMSEMQYKAYRGIKPGPVPGHEDGFKQEPDYTGYPMDADFEYASGSGMEDFDG